MYKVIDILETLGRDARLRVAGERLERFLNGEQIHPEIRAALLEGDQRALETLLGASTNVCCMVHAPDEDKPDREDAPVPDDDRDDEPAQPESPPSSSRGSYALAR